MFFLKNQNIALGLALLAIIFLSQFNFKANEAEIPILGFHGILDDKASVIFSPEESLHYPQRDLEELLEDLIRNDYWFLTTQDLYDFFLKRAKKIPKEYLKKKPIMLSIDDGHKTIHTNLLPILYKLEKKYNQKIKVVLFINPGTFPKQKSKSLTHLGCQELREGLKHGFYDIQSHGMNHQNLTKLSSQEIVYELVQAQTKLRECTKDLDPQKKVASHFAYPYGAYNERVKSYVSKYYLSSYLYNDKILSLACKKKFYEIPRLTVSRGTSFLELIRKSEGMYQLKNESKCQETKPAKNKKK
ncbi:polysaccharide deacetylase family protein [Scytonema sp. UIC 10036]|uniref:polysaccharide deacetylase family protein n=1 Tax=Scytonema sp. UIC 10036 TaxID=2304196 RepID=UPI00140F65E3